MDNVCSFNGNPFSPRASGTFGRIGARLYRATPCISNAGDRGIAAPWPNAITVLYMGAAGTGQLTKLINQLLLDINCAAIAEILPMAVKLGLNAEKVAAVVNSGTGRSYA